MSKQMSQLKAHLDNLKLKYPDNDIDYEDDGHQLNMMFDEVGVALEHKTLNEGYDIHGIKFINGLVNMFEGWVLETNEKKDVPLLPKTL